MHPDVYSRFYKTEIPGESFEAMKCPIDTRALHVFYSRMPARKTHQQVQLAVKFHSLPKSCAQSKLPSMRVHKDTPSMLAIEDRQVELTVESPSGSISTQTANSPLGLNTSALPTGQVTVMPVASGNTDNNDKIQPKTADDVANSLLAGRTQMKHRKAAGKAAAKAAAKKRPAAAHKEAPKGKKAKVVPFPGKPRKNSPPLFIGNWRVVTDWPSQVWRCNRDGKPQVCCSFRVDAERAWAKVLQTCT